MLIYKDSCGKELRRCGECNLCCRLLEVSTIDKPALQRCKHQRRTGCRVYHSRAMPDVCKNWSCRWLGGLETDTAKLKRPDRSHYVIDVMPDHVTLNGNAYAAIQVWIDPNYPHAHRDPELRAFLERRAMEGFVAVVRDNPWHGFVLVAPPMASDNTWHEVGAELDPARPSYDFASAVEKTDSIIYQFCSAETPSPCAGQKLPSRAAFIPPTLKGRRDGSPNRTEALMSDTESEIAIESETWIRELDIQIGHRLKARRLELKMSQTALATSIGIKHQQIQKYENGTGITASRLRMIARVLGVSVSYFLGESESGLDDKELPEGAKLLAQRGAADLLAAYAEMTPVQRHVYLEFGRLIQEANTMRNANESLPAHA